MATVRKTITLTNQQHDWINAQVMGRQHTKASEYIRELIDRERGTEIQACLTSRWTRHITCNA
jgi:antitoxin ParD1/3/4